MDFRAYIEYLQSYRDDLIGIVTKNGILIVEFANQKRLEGQDRLEAVINAATDRVRPILMTSLATALGALPLAISFGSTANSRGPRFGVRVRFNLYDGGRQTTNIRNAFLEQESASINTEDTNASIESNMVRLSERYDALLQQYRILLDSKEAAERSLAIAREQLQMGAINGYEFRQTQMASLQVKNQLITLMYAMKVIETDIDRISGGLIDKVL